MSKPAVGDGQIMAAEIAEALDVFARAALADHRDTIRSLSLGQLRSNYTIARGSSDAAASVISY